MLEQFGKLGKLRLAMTERRGGLALKASETIDDMDGVIGAALLAVVDDVDAGGFLLGDHVGDRLGDGGIERRVIRRTFLFRHELFHHLGRAR